jgi:hypothetical protein
MPRLALALLAASVAAAADPSAVVTADGKPAVTLTLPTGWEAVPKEAKSVILPPGGAPHIQAWMVAGRSVAEAERQVAALVVSEVTDFTTTAARDLTIAGAPARQLTGTGKEADDGDPANAEVTLFTVGGRTFLLIAHGEGDGTSKRHGEIATILASAAAAK